MMLDHSISSSSSNSFQAYLNRFDTAEQVGTRFRNRFSGQTYATEAQAQARELEVDLLVVGSHSHGATWDTPLGRTSARLVQLAEVPVYLVPMLQHRGHGDL